MKDINKLSLIFMIFSLSIPMASAEVSLCGNPSGIACPEPDKDNDGYASASQGGVDCDDNNWQIYPGVITSSGCPANQTRRCQSNGIFTSCSAAVVCEAANGSQCKYIDCASGSDTSGDGSYSNPWKSFKNVGQYENLGSRPANWYQVQAGDVIYLKGSGTCSEWYDAGPTHPNVMLEFETSGTLDKPIVFKRYPGATVVIDPPFTSTVQGHVFRLNSLSYVKLDDFEITGSYAIPVYFTSTQHVEISRLNCHDTLGSTINNIACINIASDQQDHYLHHNKIYNVYDNDQPGADNVSLIVLFGGGNNRVEYNRLYYTVSPAATGNVKGKCFKYKHPGNVGTTIFKGNQLSNCYKAAVENSAIGFNMSNNLFVNSEDYQGAVAYYCGDIGAGMSYCKNGLIENNTFVNMRAIAFRESVNSGLGNNIIRKNIVVDNSSSYGSENGFYRIERYGSEQQYASFLATNVITAGNNCYYNDNVDLKFDFFGDDSIGGPSGGMYSLSSWRSNLNQDLTSYDEDPELNQFYISISSHCATYGWRLTSSSRPLAPSGLTAVTP